MIDFETKKVLFIDLDSTLIKTISGKTFPEDITDFRIQLPVLNKIVEKFPEYDVKYSNRDLFTYHHILTGSCRIGRETFVVDKGLSLDGKTSVREFVELTKDSYGRKIIKKLPIVYGME